MPPPCRATTKNLTMVECMVASCTNPFYCGDSVTLADAVLLRAPLWVRPQVHICYKETQGKEYR